MRAIILAGGRGERLAPLTETVPKPLVPMAGRPLIDHILIMLADHGFTDVVITLGYLGEMIHRHVGNGARYGITVRYTTEQRPLGTAGSVKKALAEHPTSAPFLVIAGDAVTDMDLFEAYCHFYAQGACIGLVLAQVEDPRPYGVVTLDDTGRVRQFVEKPATLDAGCTVNTGIYFLNPRVLEQVPDHLPYDFGLQFFPQWLAAGRAIQGLEGDGYWCDMGTLQQYRNAHRDILRGVVPYPLPPESAEGVHLAASAEVDLTARLVAPVVVEEGAVIEAGAEVGPYSVVGARTFVGAWARVERSVVGEGCSLAAGVRLQGAILGNLVVVEGRASMEDMVAVGDGCRIGWGAHLRAGMRLPPGTRVTPGSALLPFHSQGTLSEAGERVSAPETA